VGGFTDRIVGWDNFCPALETCPRRAATRDCSRPPSEGPFRAATPMTRTTTEDWDMPVRSRGSLLAGTATLAGLLLVGVGCHSSPSDHDSFSMSGNGGQPANGQPPLGGTPVMMGMEPGQQAFRYVPSSSSPPASGAVRLQPVPAAQSQANKPTVIASSWQPVQRVSAEQPASGPELNGNGPVPAAPPAAMVPGMISRMPAGDTPAVDAGNGVPPNGNTSLHA